MADYVCLQATYNWKTLPCFAPHTCSHTFQGVHHCRFLHPDERWLRCTLGGTYYLSTPHLPFLLCLQFPEVYPDLERHLGSTAKSPS